MKKVKNINQTDLLELLEWMEQLEAVESELNMASSLGLLELNLGLTDSKATTTIPVEENVIVDKQIDWVALDLSY